MSIATLALLVFVFLSSLILLGFSFSLISVIAGVSGIVYGIALLVGDRIR